MDDWAKVVKILMQNKDKPFVKRILEPEKYPQIDYGNGEVASHKMAYMEEDGKYIVFPTILQRGDKLKEYAPDKAFQEVKKTGDYIEFDSEDDADWFSKNYKVVWGKQR